MPTGSTSKPLSGFVEGATTPPGTKVVRDDYISFDRFVTGVEVRRVLHPEAPTIPVLPKHDEVPVSPAQPWEEQRLSDERRKLLRKRVMLQAEVSWAGASGNVRLVDISSGGTSIRTDEPPPAGSDVKFSRGGLTVHARVAWRADGRSGLEFSELVDTAALLRRVVQRKFSPEPRFRRPPLDRRFMSEIDKQVNERPPLSWAASGLDQPSEAYSPREQEVIHMGHAKEVAHVERCERIWRLSHEINTRLFSDALRLQRFD